MKILNLTSRSISLDLDNNDIYETKEYEIYLNKKLYKKDNKNIISIFDLLPNTSYELKINDDIIDFKTLDESLFIDLKEFNCIADGIHDDTAKIQAAIMTAPMNSTIYFGKGTYLVSSLYLKSNLTLYIDKDAKILAKPNRLDYPTHPGKIDNYNIGIWEGIEQTNFASIINIYDQENINIIGEGIIDGNALNGDWYINHRIKNIAWRGHIFFSKDSRNINIIGLNFYDSPSWTIHPYMTDNIDIINVTIKNKISMPTTDGIDPDCCDNIRILGTYISVGDDCIAIKSGSYDLALKYKIPCSNLLIENNHFESGHGGVVFGSELSAGINNVTVKNCLFTSTDRGLRIKTRRGRGHVGIIDNVIFENNLMNKVKTPFVINMYYNMGNKGGHEEYVWSTKYHEFDDLTPVIGSFKFKNIICNDIEYAAGVFLGLPESKIKDIEFENVTFNYNRNAKEGYPVMIEHNILMKRIGIYTLNCGNILLENVIFNGNIGENIIEIEGDNNE
ncbi:MAG: glycoside hydrolase family 28 protein [Acholeplasmatales bacterium]|nr:glycoside hydrolase family 28 protein [Acholeplasmatales bacterium]